MANSINNDANALCDLVKGHEEVLDVKLTQEDQTLFLKVNASLNNSVDWTLLQNMAQHYFNLTHNCNIQIDYPKAPPEKQSVFLGDDDLAFVSPPKEPPSTVEHHPIITYATEKMDWKLFRFYSQSGKTLDNNYFAPRQDIADKEKINLEHTYSLILNDMQNRAFTRNIIELNINCMNANELKGIYIDLLRELPIQLKNRIAISLVRIASDVSIHNLRQAALICKLCTDNIFLSFPYKKILEPKKLNRIYGIAGFIITVEKGTVNSFDDMRKVYDRLSGLFKNKKTFVIFSDDRDIGESYKNPNILRLHEKEIITI